MSTKKREVVWGGRIMGAKMRAATARSRLMSLHLRCLIVPQLAKRPFLTLSAWSWHPWLMSSQRRRVGPTGRQTNLNPLVTVTKRNSSPGRARSKP